MASALELFHGKLLANLQNLHKYLDGLEKKQRFDITTALAGNVVDHIEYRKFSLPLKEREPLKEEERKALCKRIVDGALGNLPKPKAKKMKKIKVPKKQSEVARLLYGVDNSTTTCKDCGGSKSAKSK